MNTTKHIEWPKEKWYNIFWTERKLLFLGLGASGSLSDDPQTQNLSRSAPWRLCGRVSNIWWSGGVAHTVVLDLFSHTKIMDQFEFKHILEAVMLHYSKDKMWSYWVFQQVNTPNTPVSDQHVGSRSTGLMLQRPAESPEHRKLVGWSKLRFLRQNKTNSGM